MTQEIEVKYRVDVDDVSALEKALADRGVILSAPIHQDDQAYAEDGWTYDQPKVGRTFLRLRTQGGRHLFTLKRPLGNAMACLEHETEVTDREQMHRAILAMGFRPTARIVKTRRTTRLGEVTICVDEVENVGVFVELERTATPNQDGATVQAELDALARSFGVPLTRTTDTYDSLVRVALTSA